MARRCDTRPAAKTLATALKMHPKPTGLRFRDKIGPLRMFRQQLVHQHTSPYRSLSDTVQFQTPFNFKHRSISNTVQFQTPFNFDVRLNLFKDGTAVMGTIILAEDDELVATIAIDALMAAGHAVGWLDDGVKALNVIRQRPPDLVILDCNMPEMGGIDVLRAMRRIDRLHRVPVLMLTCRTSAHDEHIARFAGATEYLRKPFDVVELVHLVGELMGGRRRFA